MKDNVSVTKIGTLHPAIRERMTAFIEDVEHTFGLTIRIVSTVRSLAEQQALWDKGRTMPGEIVTWAPPGSSYHNYGLAADICPFKSDHSDLDWQYDFNKWKPLADKHGLKWGGDFPEGKKDPDHYPYTAGYNWRDLLHKYEIKDFIPGTDFVRL